MNKTFAQMLAPALLMIISRKANIAITVLNIQHLYFSLEVRIMKNNFQTTLAYLFICLFI